jgi:hypothetical protein
VRNALARPGRNVVWSAPSKPVLCATNGRNKALIVDKPARSDFLLHVVRHAGRLLGLLAIPNSHALFTALSLITQLTGLGQGYTCPITFCIVSAFDNNGSV